ncbi:MAG: hypothetical protein JSW51_01555 [Gemmatimonadota bacterium]|nr:MAG: hypothetical protein JSW51_01555 [Gemmatimonadota bacterium]
MYSRLVRLVALAGAVVGLACAGDGVTDPGDDNGDNGGGGGGGSGFAAVVQPIFTANCALSGCHAGSSPAQGMNLSSGQAYANIVDVPSNESGLVRVKPSMPDSSYLVHKIQGTQGSVGGSGGQMPLGRAALSQTQIDAIRQWIADGAPNN